MKFISDEEILGELEPDQMNEQDATSDELLLMAYSSMDYLEEKNQILPRANFYLETCKNILDTLRSNSKLLEFYNDTARKILGFKICYTITFILDNWYSSKKKEILNNRCTLWNR